MLSVRGLRGLTVTAVVPSVTVRPRLAERHRGLHLARGRGDERPERERRPLGLQVRELTDRLAAPSGPDEQADGGAEPRAQLALEHRRVTRGGCRVARGRGSGRAGVDRAAGAGVAGAEGRVDGIDDRGVSCRAAHRAQDERVLHAVTRVEDVVAASQRRVRARAVGVERVDARTADDRVVVAAAVERVVAVATVDLVVPAVSVEDVVPTSARDLVVAAASREPVRAGRADEDVRCVAAVDLFDVGADVVALAGLAVVGLAVEADGSRMRCGRSSPPCRIPSPLRRCRCRRRRTAGCSQARRPRRHRARCRCRHRR